MIEARRALSRDAHEIASLNRHVQQLHGDAEPQVFKPADAGALSEDDAAALITKPGHIVFIAMVDRKASGYLIAEEKRRPETARTYKRNTIFIHEISVHPDARRGGIGRVLVSAVQEHGRSIGIDRLELQTWSFNQDAHAFFETCGMEPYRIMMRTKLD